MDFMDESDEELKSAIALSLEESQNEARRKEAVRERAAGGSDDDDDHGDDDDEEEAQFQRDLAAAIEASKASDSAASSQSRASEQGRQLEDAPREMQTRRRTRTEQRRKEDEERREDSGSGVQAQAQEQQVQVQRPAFLKDRAQMERERLERVERQKRAREEGRGREGSNDATKVECRGAVSPPTKRQRISPSPPRLQPQSQSASQRQPRVRDNKNTQPGSSRTAAASANGKKANGVSTNPKAIGEKVELFWDGELRQIANRLVDKDKDDRPTFRLSEIIGPKSDVTLAILSSYANSVDWLYDFFEPTTPIIVVNQPGEAGNREIKELAPNMLMTKPFIRNGRGCMHIKIMLLFYKDGRVRVLVPTANLIEYDWRDIENTAWVQDIPMRQTTIRHDPKASDFPGTLQRVLHALNVPAGLTKFLDGDFPDLPIEALSELRMRWDWSKVKVKLVASIAGKHDGWEQVNKTGHSALMKAIQELGAQPPKGKQLVLECQGSSIGTYSTQWMNEFYCSARGESAKIWLDRPRSQRAKLPWPPVKILFPSLQTVKDSVLGMPGGGTMFCRKAQWEAKNFPRELFHDSNSKRGRVLMHSKMIIGVFREKSGVLSARSHPRGADAGEDGVAVGEEEDDVLIIDSSDNERVDQSEKSNEKGKERLIGWAYVGSHNFTPSAWGTLSGSAANPSLNIVNYELGIALPLKTYDELEKVACWKRPARKYAEGVDRPWMQEEMQEGLAIMQD